MTVNSIMRQSCNSYNMVEQERIIGTIEVDSSNNVHCNDVALPHRYIEYKGCECSLFASKNTGDNADIYPLFCLIPETIDISFTGIVEKENKGDAHVGQYVFSKNVPKYVIKAMRGKAVTITKIHPIYSKDTKYKGVIIHQKAFSPESMEERASQPGSDSLVYYLIDTNAFIDCPEILDRFGEDTRVIIVNQVILELDGLKKSPDENISRAARLSSSNILDVSGYKEMVFVKTKDPYEPFEPPYTPDQKILAAAFLASLRDKDVVLVSSDKNMLLMAKAYGVKAESLIDFLNGNDVNHKRKKKVNWKVIIMTVGVVAAFALGVAVGRATAPNQQ